MKNRIGLFASVLIALCTQLLPQAQALTLGDLRGTAVLGRSLDVSVQIQTGPGEELSAACVKAEVFFADAPQMAPTVTVGVATGALSEVRIQSSAMVNEPVVMVQVYTTCGSSNTRRYVMLADFPQTPQRSELQSVAATSSQAVQAPVPQPASARSAEVTKPSTATPEINSAVNGNLAAKSPASSKNGSKVRDVSSTKSRTRPTGNAVLKLDPLDIFSDRMDKLDSLMLFEPTEDAVKQTRQITALQDDLKAMRDLASKNDAQLAALRSQLEQAQTQQVPIWLVYALLGLVVLCLIILGWLWSKQRQSHKGSDWWQHEDGPPTILIHPKTPENTPETAEVTGKTVKPAGAIPTSTVAYSHPAMTAASAAKTAKIAKTVPDVDLDIDLDSFMLPDKKSDSAPSEPLLPMPVGGIHHINAESILDIRQQAEFFMSLGQTDRAINLLKLQIEEAAEPNPMVYLDLITLYHSLGMKTDFRELRDAFQKEFNARMPDFPAFNVAGKELEHYPEVMEKLESMWPQTQSLAYLDTCIFHNPLVPVRPMFELNAFRDILLLHALVEDINADLPSLGNLSAAFESPVSIPASLEPPAEMTSSASVMPPPLSERPAQSAQHLVHDEAHSMDFSLEEEPVDELPKEPADVSLEPESTPDDEPAEVAQGLPVEASTSMMLDLDFSSLAMPESAGLQSTDDAEPINHPPVRYATRSHVPEIKKSK